MALKESNKAINTGTVNIFHPKIIDTESKGNRECLVAEKTSCVWGRKETIGGKDSKQAIIGKDTRLRKAIDALAGLSHDMPIVHKWGKIVGSKNGSRNDVDWNANVLVDGHVGIQVEILDIKSHVLSLRGGHNTIEVAFDGGHVNSGCADVARIVNTVPTGSETNAIRVSLVGSESSNNAKVCGSTIRRFLGVGDKKQGISAGTII
jgi:hypothetical protein